MVDTISSLPFFAPLAIGWDFGALMDNAIYQGTMFLATLLWAPHAIMFALARYLTLISLYMSTGLLPAAIGIVTTFVTSTNLASTLTTIALMLVGIGYLVEPYLPEFRLASLGRIAIFATVMVLVLSYGPDIVAQLEIARVRLALGIADSAFGQFMDDAAFSGVAGSLAASPEEGMTNAVISRDYDGLAGMSAYDVAASAIPVCPSATETWVDDYFCSRGTELSVSLPLAFRGVYMRYGSLTDGMSGEERTEAKDRAWKGVSRLAMTLPITLVSLQDAIAGILFSVAAGFILLTLPIALLFAVFLPLENMATSLMRMYLNLFVYTGVVAVLTSIGVAGLVAALQTGVIAPLVGASALAFLMESIAIKVGLTAMSNSFFAFGNSLTANLGLSGNIQGDVMGTVTKGAGVAVGLATGGAGLGLMALAGTQQGTAQGGTMALAGGAMVGRSPLRGPGMALGTLAMGRRQGGGIGRTLADSSMAEAAVTGMSAGSGSPWGMFYAMNRLTSGAGRRRGDGGRRTPSASTGPHRPDAEQGPDASPPPHHLDTEQASADWASPHYLDTGQARPGDAAPGRPPQSGQRYRPTPNSPWRSGVDAAAGRYGTAWVDAVAARARQMAASYRNTGLNDVEIAAQFSGPNGQPALDSPGGRGVVRGLPATVCGTLNTPQAREGVQAVIADVVAPRLTRDVGAIAQAIAGAVAGPGRQSPHSSPGSPAGDVAAALSARPQDLGGYYGAVGRFVGLARQHNLDGGTVRQVVTGVAGGRDVGPQVAEALRQSELGIEDARRLIRAAQLLPERLEITAGRLSQARAQGAESSQGIGPPATGSALAGASAAGASPTGSQGTEPP